MASNYSKRRLTKISAQAALLKALAGTAQFPTSELPLFSRQRLGRDFPLSSHAGAYRGV